VRPVGTEALRGLQAALMSAILPELQTQFAQDASQTMQMLLESLIGEWDAAVENLHADNQRLRDLLARASAVILAAESPGEQLESLAREVEDGLAAPGADSLLVSALSEENRSLRALLERVIVACEEMGGESGPLGPVRSEMYAHLRDVTGRGWSFWDVMSFRERMARLRAG